MGYRQRSTVKLLGERPTKASGIKYVVTPKALLLDGSLTADARLVGIYLLSLSDGWEINFAQIAEALGMPTRSKRVNAAVKNLEQRGWLQHNKYADGSRIYKHEFVMNRSHRMHAPDDSYSVESTPLRESQNPAYSVESTPLYSVESTPSPKYHSKGPAKQGHLDRDLLAPSGAGGGKDLEVLETRVAQWSGLKMADQAPAVTQAPPRSVTEERDTNVPPLVGKENGRPFVSQSNCYGCGAALGDDIAPDPAGMPWHRQCAADLQCVPECTVDGHRCHLVGP